MPWSRHDSDAYCRDAMSEPSATVDFDCDSALLACARGERGALRTIYEEEAPRLLGLAMRILRRRDLAEDAVHDAFVKIWEKAGTFDPRRGSGRGWIYTVVRHQAINMIRERRHDAPLNEAQLEELPAEGGDPFDLTATLADSSALARCLEQLDPPKRASIVLAYVEGCSHAEIAARLKVPLGTAKAWIRRGLQALRGCLG
jgi:RNA polymerase sigma factor (sigma-70 family)